MFKKRTVFISLLFIFSTVLLLVACNQVQETNEPQPQTGESGANSENKIENGQSSTEVHDQDTSINTYEMPSEEVTLTLYSHWAAINNDKDVEDLFGTALENHPNIQIKLLRDVKMEDLIAAGEVPDLVAVPNGSMYDMLLLDLASDLTDFVADFDIDLNKLEPEAINALLSYSDDDKILGIPYTLNYGLLIYNKDIFDRFAVDYPTDGMTWEELSQLAVKLTRRDDGEQYIGLDPGPIKSLSRSYLLPTMDENEENPILAGEGYQNLFSMLKNIFDIPGIVDQDENRYSYGVDYFLKEQKLAMHSVWLAAITSRLPNYKDELDWDLAGHPVHTERPDVGKEIEFQSLLVTPTTENRAAVYHILAGLLSEDSQQKMNANTNLTILNKPDWRTNFAANTDLFHGKNLSGIFSVKPAAAPRYSKFDQGNYSFLSQALRAVVLEGEDINTALREANEMATQHILELKAQQ